VDLHGGWRSHGPVAFGTVRIGVSDREVLPSLGAEVRGLRVSSALAVTGSATAWLQPRALRWGAPPTPGGAVSARLEWDASPRWAPFLGLRAKTAGWEPGIAALDPATYVIGGALLGLGRPSARWGDR
jgi:hypothetical protein